jgi:hypothetical protein
VPPGAPRVNLLYVADCLLSHARLPSAPPAAADLPAKAGAGLPRMLALAATDAASLGRVRKALDAWSRKGLLDAGYLRLGVERLEALARSIEAAARRSSDGGAPVRGGCDCLRSRLLSPLQTPCWALATRSFGTLWELFSSRSLPILLFWASLSTSHP